MLQTGSDLYITRWKSQVELSPQPNKYVIILEESLLTMGANNKDMLRKSFLSLFLNIDEGLSMSPDKVNS